MKLMKKGFSLLLAFTLTFGANVNALAATTFADINDVPWEGAKTYINSVSDLSLMVGDTNSAGQRVFRSEDKVTYCEATQLVYSILTKVGKASYSESVTTKWAAIMNGNKIPSWAQSAVSYALENKILSIDDISRFMKNATTQNYATREDVAVIFGKALSPYYTINTSPVLTYEDASSIASTSAPYVDLLSRLSILVGDNNNKFNPKNYINRAEMAVITSKSYTTSSDGQTSITPDSDNVKTGVVIDIEYFGSSTMITIVSGTENMGFIGDDTAYVVYGSEQVLLSSINVGDNITITYTGSKIDKIVVNSYSSGSVSGSSTISGVLDDVENDRLSVYVNGDKEEYLYYYASSYTIKIDGVTSTLKELFDAYNEYTVNVEITLNTKGSITYIEATRNLVYVTGEITSIDSDEITIEKSNKSSVSYDFASNATIRLEGTTSTISKISTALKQDTLYAAIYLNTSNKILKLYVSEDEFDDSETETVTGTIKAVDTDGITIRRSSSSSKYYDFDSSVAYYYETTKVGQAKFISYFEEDDDRDYDVYVSAEINSSGDVVSVKASTDEDDVSESDSSSDYDVKGSLYALSKIRLTVTLSSGDTERYYFPDDISDVTIKIDGSTGKDYDDLYDEFDYYGSNGIYVYVTLDSNEYVSKIVAETDYSDSSSSSTTIKGTITILSTNKIKVSGSSTTYSIEDEDDLTVAVYDGTMTSQKITDYSDLEKAYENDKEIYATLTVKNGYATKVSGYVQEASGSIATISTSSRSIKIKNPNTSGYSTYYYSSSGSLSIKIDGVKNLDIYDLIDSYEDYTLDAVLTLDEDTYYITDIVAETD
ncbi:MAG: S-layer homology domain-containing protein [Lachnospiraceae bacterium]|nr:S-layer homology domain-containing protein [Lachnospiraceae bacterium]